MALTQAHLYGLVFAILLFTIIFLIIRRKVKGGIRRYENIRYPEETRATTEECRRRTTNAGDGHERPNITRVEYGTRGSTDTTKQYSRDGNVAQGLDIPVPPSVDDAADGGRFKWYDSSD